MNLLPLAALSVDQLHDLLTNPSAFDVTCTFLLNGIQVNVGTDSAGLFLREGQREFRALDDFSGVYDQPLKLFFAYCQREGIKAGSFFIHHEPGMGQIVPVGKSTARDAMIIGVSEYVSPDGLALFYRDGVTTWKVINQPTIKLARLLNDERARQHVDRLQAWLNDPKVTRVLTANLAQAASVTKDERDAARAELRARLVALTRVLESVAGVELREFKRLTGHDGKLVTTSPTLSVDLKDELRFKRARAATVKRDEALRIYADAVDRILRLLDVNEKRDLTKLFTKLGDLRQLEKAIARTVNGMEFRRKIIAILENAIDEISAFVAQNRDLSAIDKLYVAERVQRCRRLRSIMRKTASGDAVVSKVIDFIMLS